MSDTRALDLVFALPRGVPTEDALLDAVFEAGFDDVVVGLGAAGLIGVTLDRVDNDVEAFVDRTTTALLRVLPRGAALHAVRRDSQGSGGDR